MRISILAPGTREAIQPFLALGAGLAWAGHTVRVATEELFRPLATEWGLQFTALDEGRGALNACHGAEAIVAAGESFLLGVSLAEKLGIPVSIASLGPITPPREASGRLLPRKSVVLRPLSRLGYQRPTYGLSLESRGKLAMERANAVRSEVLELPPLPSRLSRHVVQADPQFLFGYSESVLPRPRDWSPRSSVTGYWFLPGQEAWDPPSELADFLGAGSPPVYFNFGPANRRNPAATAALVMRALRLSKQRGVLISEWSGLHAYRGTEDLLAIDYARPEWIFPRVRAVVHHGQATTVAQALYAGRPSMVVASSGEDRFWGERTLALEAGPAPIAWEDLTADRLAEAIVRLVNTRTYLERAAWLGERVRAEDGVGRAVELVESWVPRHLAG